MKTVLMLSSLIAATTAASASPLNETFNVTIYQGPGNGAYGDADNQAQQGNPLIAPAYLLGIGTYAGALNLNEAPADIDSIGTFLATAGGSVSGFSSAAMNAPLSTTAYGITTLMIITGNTNGNIISGTIDHDDGISLYDGSGFSNLVVGSPSPTTDIPTDFSGLFGPFELVYVEANGPPGVLDFNITSSVATTPLPTTLPMFAGGLGLFWWMRKRRSTAAPA